MTELRTAQRPFQWLAADARRRLERRLSGALSAARSKGRPVIASSSSRPDGAVDPTAVAAASRLAGEPWFCFEQPDRDGYAVAALGCVRAIEAAGSRRFAEVEERWRRLSAEAVADAPAGPPGCGLVALGGFAFAPDGGESPTWEGFAPASLVVPEISLARRGEATWLTINAEVAPDDTVEGLLDRVRPSPGRAPAPGAAAARPGAGRPVPGPEPDAALPLRGGGGPGGGEDPRR